MSKNKLLIGTGIVAAICIMAANLQYAYSDYGIKTNSLHSEVLAQYQCYSINQQLEVAKSQFQLSNCVMTRQAINECDRYSTTTCINGCYMIKSLEEQLKKCLESGSSIGGSSSGGSTTGRDPSAGSSSAGSLFKYEFKQEQCSEITYYNDGSSVQKFGKFDSCVTGKLLITCTATECVYN